jgi:hypothetical protein
MVIAWVADSPVPPISVADTMIETIAGGAPVCNEDDGVTVKYRAPHKLWLLSSVTASNDVLTADTMLI